MLKYILPLELVVISNIFYQICAKSAPGDMNPLASLTVTYGVGAVVSLILFFLLNRNASLFQEYSKLNWAPFVLGIAIVGLEVGYIYAYKAGWSVSTAPLVQSAALSIFLVFVGNLLYKEPITWNKTAGILVCLAGLGLIALK